MARRLFNCAKGLPIYRRHNYCGLRKASIQEGLFSPGRPKNDRITDKKRKRVSKRRIEIDRYEHSREVSTKSREKAADVILAFTQGRVYTLLLARRLHGELLSQL